MIPPDPTAPWDVRVRQWAIRYWDGRGATES